MRRPSSDNQGVGNSNYSLTRLHLGSLSLQPADLLDSLNKPLSGNLVLQVTLYTPLVLRGRTTEFPRSDFNRQVTRYTRHAINECNPAPARWEELGVKIIGRSQRII